MLIIQILMLYLVLFKCIIIIIIIIGLCLYEREKNTTYVESLDNLLYFVQIILFGDCVYNIT